MPGYEVGYFAASLSSASINRVPSRPLIRLAPEDSEYNRSIPGALKNMVEFRDHVERIRTVVTRVRDRAILG